MSCESLATLQPDVCPVWSVESTGFSAEECCGTTTTTTTDLHIVSLDRWTLLTDSSHQWQRARVKRDVRFAEDLEQDQLFQIV